MATLIVSLGLLLSPQYDWVVVQDEDVEEVELWTLGLMTAAAYIHLTMVEEHCFYNRYPWCGGGGKEWYIYRARCGWGRPTAQQIGVAWGGVMGGQYGLFRGFIDLPAGSRLSLCGLVRFDGNNGGRQVFCEAVQRMALPPEPSVAVGFTDIGGFRFLWLRGFYGFCFGGGCEVFFARPYVFRFALREYYVSAYRGAIQAAVEVCVEMEGVEIGAAYRYFVFHGSRVDESDFGGLFFWIGVWL